MTRQEDTMPASAVPTDGQRHALERVEAWSPPRSDGQANLARYRERCSVDQVDDVGPGAPPWPVCRRCKTRHEPRPHPAGGRGVAALYGQQVVPDPNRPPPLGQEADETPLELRRFRPWTGL
jgi:hypothetical protein